MAQVRTTTMPTATRRACRSQGNADHEGIQNPRHENAGRPYSQYGDYGHFPTVRGNDDPLPWNHKPGFQSGQVLVFRLPRRPPFRPSPWVRSLRKSPEPRSNPFRSEVSYSERLEDKIANTGPWKSLLMNGKNWNYLADLEVIDDEVMKNHTGGALHE
jgi:hypothetical protein